MEKTYKKFFNILEIEKDVVLQLFGGAILQWLFSKFSHLGTQTLLTNINSVENATAAMLAFLSKLY